MGLKIAGSITGPLTLTPSDNPLTVTSTGVIASTGANNDGVDGAAVAAWTIIDKGTISSQGGWGVNLAGAGVLDNSGDVSGLLGGFETGGFETGGFETGGFETGGFETGGFGLVKNNGMISGTGIRSYGVLLNMGGSITNEQAGSIASSGVGVDVEGAFGELTNNGTISGKTGVILDAGGSITNNADGAILGEFHTQPGVYISSGIGVVSNKG